MANTSLSGPENLYTLHFQFFGVFFASKMITFIRTYLQAEWKNSVDLDEITSQKPADLDLHCIMENSRLLRKCAFCFCLGES